MRARERERVCVSERETVGGMERERGKDGGREEEFNPAWITGQTGAGRQEEREEVPPSSQLSLPLEVHR